MARKRMIDPDFWTDEALGSCPAMTRLLFMGLISHADDDGRLRGTPALIRSQVFPYDDLTIENVEGMLDDLIDARLILRYQVAGQSYISIRSFNKHQTINKPTPSRLPPPPCRPTDPPLPESYGSPTVALPSNRREEKVREEKGSELATDAAAPPLNPRDLHWDTQVEIFGFSPTRDTPEHGRWQKSTGIWRKLKATPEQMLLAADLYVQAFPDAAFTAIALAGRAEQLLKGHKPNPPPRVEDIKSPTIRSLTRMSQEDYDAATRDIPAENGRSGVLPAAPRGLGSGERPPQRDVRAASGEH